MGAWPAKQIGRWTRDAEGGEVRAGPDWVREITRCHG